RNVHVQIHTVDALHLEHHMISKHISHSTRYCHHQLRSAGSRKANYRTTRSIHRTGPQPVTVTTHRPEPTHPPSPPPHASSGWGEAPLALLCLLWLQKQTQLGFPFVSLRVSSGVEGCLLFPTV